MKTKAHGLFRGGEMYAASAYILNTSEQFTPSVVLGALSLELYFKALFILDAGREFKVNGFHSHDFLTLFDELSDTTRDALVREFNGEVSKADTSFIKTIKKETGAVVSLQLRDNLDQWRDVFVKLRYIHEFNASAKSSGAKRYWCFFEQMERAVKRVCFDKESSWMQ